MNSAAEWISAHCEEVIPSGGRWNEHFTAKFLLYYWYLKAYTKVITTQLNSKAPSFDTTGK